MISVFNKAFINKVETSLKGIALDKQTRIASRIHAELVNATPFDEGRAEAGWNIALNSLDKKIPVAPYAPQDSEPPILATKLGDTYNVTNAVNYIIYLNEGSSKRQAPANFVELTIDLVLDDENRGGK